MIHITVNTKKIPSRKGVGNKPFLFLASGSLSLSDPEGTLRLGMIDTTRWNRIGAYERFLKAEAEKDRAAKGIEDIDEDIDCGLDPDTVYSFVFLQRPKDSIPPSHPLHYLFVRRHPRLSSPPSRRIQ